uniref:HEPN_MAE_28990 domain-containing protein n=1 Tax=Haemonchus placei TaxID=6290 RepID=A0A0N4X506_HAEPC
LRDAYELRILRVQTVSNHHHLHESTQIARAALLALDRLFRAVHEDFDYHGRLR